MDLRPCGVENHRLQVGRAHQALYGGNDLEHCERSLRAEIKGLTMNARIVQPLGQLLERRNDVFDINIVPDVAAIAPDHGPLAKEACPDRIGNEAAPVEVSSAVDVSATRNRYRQPVRSVIGLREQ